MKKLNWLENYSSRREMVSDAQMERLMSRYERHEGEDMYSYKCRLAEEFFERLGK